MTATTKHKLLTTLPLILLLASCQNLSSVKDDSAAKNDPTKLTVASYNGGEITLSDVNNEINKLIAKNEKLKGLTFDKLNSDQKEAIIKEIVLKNLAYKEAKKRNLDDDQDYRQALKIFETELLKQKLFIALAKEAAEENNVKKNYDEIVEKLTGKKDLRISYIAVKTQKEAEEIYKSLLTSPQMFSKQAKTKSLDKEIAKKGGDLGFVLEEALPAEVVKQARSVKKGQIAAPVLTSGNWVIVKFVDERPAAINSFEKSKDALAQNLAKKALEDFAKQSLEKADIKILSK